MRLGSKTNTGKKMFLLVITAHLQVSISILSLLTLLWIRVLWIWVPSLRLLHDEVLLDALPTCCNREGFIKERFPVIQTSRGVPCCLNTLVLQ